MRPPNSFHTASASTIRPGVVHDVTLTVLFPRGPCLTLHSQATITRPAHRSSHPFKKIQRTNFFFLFIRWSNPHLHLPLHPLVSLSHLFIFLAAPWRSRRPWESVGGVINSPDNSLIRAPPSVHGSPWARDREEKNKAKKGPVAFSSCVYVCVCACVCVIVCTYDFHLIASKQVRTP